MTEWAAFVPCRFLKGLNTNSLFRRRRGRRKGGEKTNRVILLRYGEMLPFTRRLSGDPLWGGKGLPLFAIRHESCQPYICLV